MKRTRVAIVVAHFDATLDYFETTAASHLARTFDVHVITSTFRSQTLVDAGHTRLTPLDAGTSTEGGVTVHRLPHRLRQGQRVLGEGVYETLCALEPALLIQVAPSQFFSVPATRFGRLHGTPVIYVSGENSQQGPQAGLALLIKRAYSRTVLKRIIRLAAEGADKVVATTPETATLIRRCSSRVDPEVIPLPFRASRFFRAQDRGRSLAATLGIEGGHVTALVGRAVPTKRLEVVLSAWEASAEGHPQAHLVIAGLAEDDYSNSIRNAAHSSSLADRIHLCSFLPHADVNALLNLADVTVWPTVSVGIQQSMATGAYVLLPRTSPGAFLVGGQGSPLGETYESGRDSSDFRPLAQAIERSRAKSDESLRSRRTALAHSLYSDDATMRRLLNGVLEE